MFMDEADKINSSLELQKTHFSSLKEQQHQLRQESRELKDEIRREMFRNKETEIACNKITHRNEAIKEFLAINHVGKGILDIRLKESGVADQPYRQVSGVSLFD